MLARLRSRAGAAFRPRQRARSAVTRLQQTTPSTRIWLGIAALGTAVDLFLRSRVPFSLGLPSGQDAVLFVRQATALHAGNWLGPFDGVILAKGPAYPAFMALAYTLHLGLAMADQLAWLLAAAAVGACVRVTVGGIAAPVLVYLFVACDPAMFDAEHSEVYRDSLYQSASLLVVALTFLALRSAIVGSSVARWITLGALAGLSLAAFWLCREEGPWLLPCLAVLAAGLAAGALWRRLAVRKDRPVTRAHLGRWAVRGVGVVAVLTVFFLVPVEGVKLENHHRYGVALTNDMTQGQFPRAFAQWTRVETGPAVVHVPITLLMREAVYAVSPAAAEMQPFIESPQDPWYAISCGRRTRPNCDITGAFTPWALRRGAALAGHMGTERAMQSYFRTVADQIAAACRDGRLICRRQVSTSLQPFLPATAANVKAVLKASWHEVLWSQYMYELPGAVRTLSPATQAATAAIIRGYDSPQQAPRTLASFRSHSWPYHVLIRVYRFLVPLLTLVATVAFLAELVWWRRRASALAVLGVGLAVAIASRLVLFSFVGATQYGTVGDIRYQLPTHGLLLAYGAVGAAVAARRLAPLPPLIRGRVHRRPADAPAEAEKVGAVT